MSNTRSRSIGFKDDVMVGDGLRGISLGISGDPIIHMWIMDRCVCEYTARVEFLCVLDVFSLPLSDSFCEFGLSTSPSFRCALHAVTPWSTGWGSSARATPEVGTAVHRLRQGGLHGVCSGSMVHRLG